ncbi:MAG: hypothetical protein ACE5PV_07215 [Candidatus Poribacteria bacterium]
MPRTTSRRSWLNRWRCSVTISTTVGCSNTLAGYCGICAANGIRISAGTMTAGKTP